MQRALMWKIAVISVVALLLQIPVEMIRGLVAERKQARDGVVADIARGTSEAQRIVGPVLYVPWTRTFVDSVSSFDERGRRHSSKSTRVEKGVVAVLPEILKIEGTIELQEKHRSLYTVPLYTLKASLHGAFVLSPKLAGADGAGTFEWGQPRLVLGLSDTRGIRENVGLEWRGTRTVFAPGTLDAAGIPSGIHADLGILPPEATRESQAHEFRVDLSLLGTHRLEFIPVGNATTVSLSSTWPHPSFTGRILPDAGTEVSDSGFSATWRTSHIATNLAQLYERCVQSRQCEPFQQYGLGVSFYQPVDLYQAVERSVKYGFIFIGLTFVAFFLFEVLKRLAIHPVQYALVGVALAVFFLLLISLSEHLGFALAYASAAAACVVLIGYYVGHVLHSFRRGAGFGVLLSSLYGLLYILLRAEDHALLAGSVLVFAALAATMVATRRFDWYSLAANPPAQEAPASHKPA